MADLTDMTSGEHITDDDSPPARPAVSPLEAPVPQNFNVTQSTGSALDKLAAAKTGDAVPAKDSEVEDPIAKAADEARAKREEANAKRVAAEKKTKEDAAAKKVADTNPKNVEAVKKQEATPAAKEPTAEEKKAADEQAQKDAAAKTAVAEPQDALSKVALPPYVKPATVTAFDQVKKVARETIASLETKIKETEAKIPKDGGLTPEIKKEVEELRNFRAVHDYQGTPEFKNTFAKPIAANDDVIFTKLKDNGFSEEQIVQIKKIGTGKLDWEPVLKDMQPAARRSIEAKLLENENIADKMKAALATAEKSPGEYAEKIKKENDQKQAEEIAAVKTTAEAILEQIPEFKAKEIPVGASADERKQLEEDNKFFGEQQQRLKDILADRSPGMIGQLVASTLVAYQYKRQIASLTARASAAETELKKIRDASRGRRESAAPSGGPVPKRETSILMDAGSALDKLAAEQAASRG